MKLYWPRGIIYHRYQIILCYLDRTKPSSSRWHRSESSQRVSEAFAEENANVYGVVACSLACCSLASLCSDISETILVRHWSLGRCSRFRVGQLVSSATDIAVHVEKSTWFFLLWNCCRRTGSCKWINAIILEYTVYRSVRRSCMLTGKTFHWTSKCEDGSRSPQLYSIDTSIL